MRPLILASSSPRRKQWLESLSIPFEVVAPDIDETPCDAEDPADLVLRLAKGKAALISSGNPGRWVLAADTTVAVDHHTLNKPLDVEDAVRMLMLIQARRHEVHTGMCLQHDQDVHAFVDTAEVYMRPLSEAQARWYVSSGEPMDKAGSYAAQGIAALFIERIEGSFATVMGLPVERLSALMKELGLLQSWIGMPS